MNAAADNYVGNMNAGFRWHFISIFDLLHGNQQPLNPLRPPTSKPPRLVTSFESAGECLSTREAAA